MPDVVVVDDLAFFAGRMGPLQAAATQSVQRLRDDQTIARLLATLPITSENVLAEDWRCVLPHRPDGFWISLESGSLISGADALIEMTRCAVCACQYMSGPFGITARQGTPPLSAQFDAVARRYEAAGKPPNVAITDDGVGGGRTIRFVASELAQRGVPITEIAVMANIRAQRSIEQIPVTRIGHSSIDGMWFPARDLIWGLALGGVSLVEGETAIGGVPYFLAARALEIRAGAAQDLSEQLRTLSLALTRAFWMNVEEALGRAVLLGELARLQWLPLAPGTPILELVDQLSNADQSDLVATICRCGARTPW